MLNTLDAQNHVCEGPKEGVPKRSSVASIFGDSLCVGPGEWSGRSGNRTWCLCVCVFFLISTIYLADQASIVWNVWPTIHLVDIAVHHFNNRSLYPWKEQLISSYLKSKVSSSLREHRLFYEVKGTPSLFTVSLIFQPVEAVYVVVNVPGVINNNFVCCTLPGVLIFLNGAWS